jgi:hypothetical protein
LSIDDCEVALLVNIRELGAVTMLRPPQISANRGLAPRRTRRIPREPGRLWPELARGFPLGKPPPGRRFLAGLGGARTKSPREDLSAPKACPAQHPKGPAGTASALPGTCEEVRGPSPPLSSWHLGMFDLVRPSPSSQISGRHVLVPPHAPRVARPPQRLCPKPARIFPSANAFLGPQVLRHLPAARAVPREKDLCEPRACPAQHPKGPAGTGKALAGACEELPFGKASAWLAIPYAPSGDPLREVGPRGTRKLDTPGARDPTEGASNTFAELPPTPNPTGDPYAASRRSRPRPGRPRIRSVRRAGPRAFRDYPLREVGPRGTRDLDIPGARPPEQEPPAGIPEVPRTQDPRGDPYR